MELIMLDYLSNMRIEHVLNVLKMPAEKCSFPDNFLQEGSSSGLFWHVMKYLKPKEIRRKIKMLSHMHRQMYFLYKLVEQDQSHIDKKECYHGLSCIPRVLSFKPRNFIDYLLLSSHVQLQDHFYNRLIQHSESD